MLKRNDLHEYQNYAVSFIKDRRKCALFLDMGLGKTSITLTALKDLFDNFEISKVIILAPLRVCNSVWKQEVSNWEHLTGLRVSICTGSVKERTDAFNSNADIYLMNFENLQWFDKNIKWDFDALVIDESSAFKSHSSKRFKVVKKYLLQVNTLIELTGTPIPNGYMHLWSQIFLIDFGKRLGKHITNYRKRFFDRNPYVLYTWDIRDGSEAKIKEAIDDICITMYADDKLDLPGVVYINEFIEMPNKAIAQYKELENEYILFLKGDIEDIVIESPSAAILQNKLLQVCNGAIYDLDKNYHLLHDEKIDRLKEIVQDNPSENLLVAYNFKSDLIRLQKAFPNARVLDKHEQTIKDWNDGKISILFAHPASAGHGLNLQKGGSVLVWFGMNWSLELYMQFNARINRQGQTKRVRILHILAKGTLDEIVLKRVAGKFKTQKDLLDHFMVTNTKVNDRFKTSK